MQYIVSFDILEKIYPEFTNDIGVTPTEPYNIRFDRLGYNSRNIIDNMGTIVIFLFFIIFKIVVSILFSLMRCKCNQRKSNGKWYSCIVNAQVTFWCLT